MSFYTGTQMELIYCWSGAGPALTATVTQTSLNPTVGTQPGPKIPAQLPGTPVYKSYRLLAAGIMTTAATAVSFSVRPYLGLTDGALTTALYPAAGTIGGFPATTPSISLTGLPWMLELSIVITALGTSGTWMTVGDVSLMTSATAGNGFCVGNGSTAITLSTVVDQYITIAGVLGNTTASNTLTLTTLKLYGCN
jgi:hypothetical protein